MQIMSDATPAVPFPGRRVLIVGGVAGGASCAARLRRLDETAEIVVFDRGPYVAFANCGLPYFVGDVIADEAKLLVASPELFRDRFNIAVHTDADVVGIDPAARTIAVRDVTTGTERTERYDVLVLSPGAAPIRPALPGIDRPGVFAVQEHPRLATHPRVDHRAACADGRGRRRGTSSASRWSRTCVTAGSMSRSSRSCRR
jgi:NADPH-dependent 2,4-dienoyl-CoA reductase/sulfur reductase-like enzyme